MFIMRKGVLSSVACAALLLTSFLSLVDSFQAVRQPLLPHNLQTTRLQKSHGIAPFGGHLLIPFGPFSVDHTTALSLSEGPPDDKDPTTGKISIVYCTGCRWMMRAAYFAQELLTTFHDDLSSVTLVPSRPPAPGGTFLVTLDGKSVWNRKSEGGFPEVKELKQRIRDIIAPNLDLGHSDVSDDKQVSAATGESAEPEVSCDECPDEGESVSHSIVHASGGDVGSLIPPHVSIVYCTGCKWMFRAAWYAQEILSTFQEEVNSVSLVPSRDAKGTFTVTLDNEVIWDRKAEGGHAEAKDLKQRIRDVIVPDRNLGHSDVKSKENDHPFTELSDDDAEEQRRMFGVM